MTNQPTNEEITRYLDMVLIDRLKKLMKDQDFSVETKVRIVKFETDINTQLKDSLQ